MFWRVRGNLPFLLFWLEIICALGRAVHSPLVPARLARTRRNRDSRRRAPGTAALAAVQATASLVVASCRMTSHPCWAAGDSHSISGRARSPRPAAGGVSASWASGRAICGTSASWPAAASAWSRRASAGRISPASRAPGTEPLCPVIFSSGAAPRLAIEHHPHRRSASETGEGNVPSERVIWRSKPDVASAE